MSGKRGPNTDSGEIEDIQTRSSEKIPITSSPLEPAAVDDPDKKVKPTVEADPAKAPPPKEKQDSYPPIITIDGRVDTDIDHLIEDLADDYHGPVDEIPSKFPKPHVFSVIEGSLDDDVDSFANDDGTMEHTLVDAPKNFNPKDLQDVASSEASRKSSAGHSKLGQMQSSHTDRSHNKMHADTYENENQFQQRKSNQGFKKRRCKETLRENNSRYGSKYLKKQNPSLSQRAEENFIDTFTIVQMGDSEDAASAISDVCRPGSVTQVQAEVSTSVPELGRAYLRRNASYDSQRPVVMTTGDSHVSDCYTYPQECKPHDTDSAFFMHAHTESLTCSLTDESVHEGQLSLDVLRKDQSQGHSFSESDSDEESLGIITSTLFECGHEPRLRRELEHTLYHFPSYSDESMTRSSELYPRSRYLPHSDGQATSGHILQTGQPLAHGRCSFQATNYTRNTSSLGQTRIANTSFSSQCIHTCCVQEKDHDLSREPKNTSQISNQSPRKKTKLTLAPSAFADAESSKTPIVSHGDIACSGNLPESLVSNECRGPFDQITVHDKFVSKTFSYHEAHRRPPMSVTREIKTSSLQEDLRGDSRYKSTQRLCNTRPHTGNKLDQERTTTEHKCLTSANLEHAENVKQSHMSDYVEQKISDQIASVNSEFSVPFDSVNERHQPRNISETGNIMTDSKVTSPEEVRGVKSCYGSSDSESLDSESHYLLHQLRLAHMTKKKAKNLLRHVQNILEDSDKFGEQDKACKETDERMLESCNERVSPTNQETFHYHTNNIFTSPEGTQTMTKTSHITQTDIQNRSYRYYDNEDRNPKPKSWQNRERGLVQSLVHSWDRKHQDTVGSKLISSGRIFKPVANLLSVAALDSKAQQAAAITESASGDNTVKNCDTTGITHANTNSVMAPLLLGGNSQQARSNCQKPFGVRHFGKEVDQPSKEVSSQEEVKNNRKLEKSIIHDDIQVSQIQEYKNQPVSFTFDETHKDHRQLGDQVCRSIPTEEAEEYLSLCKTFGGKSQDKRIKPIAVGADKSGIETLADNHAVNIKGKEDDGILTRDFAIDIENKLMGTNAIPMKQSRETTVTHYRVSQDLTSSGKHQALLVPAHQCYSCHATAFSCQKHGHSPLQANKACQADSDLNGQHHFRAAVRETRRDKASGPAPLRRVAATPGNRLNVSASSVSWSPESTPDGEGCPVRFSQAGLRYFKEDIGEQWARSQPRKARNSTTVERRVSPDHCSVKEVTYSKPKINNCSKRMKTRSSSIKDSLRVAYKIAEESMAAAARVAEALNVVIRTSQMSPMSSSAEVKVCLKKHTKDRVVSSSSSKRGNEKTKTPVEQLQILPANHPDKDTTNQKTLVKSYSRKKETMTEKANTRKTTVHTVSSCDRNLRYESALTSPVKRENFSRNSKKVRDSNNQKRTKMEADGWRQVLYTNSTPSNGCVSSSWGETVERTQEHFMESVQRVPCQVEHSQALHSGVEQFDKIMLEYTREKNTNGSQVIHTKAWPSDCMCCSDNSEQHNSSSLHVINVEEDLINLKEKNKTKKDDHGSVIADREESSKFNVPRAQWSLPKSCNSSLQKTDAYFTKTPPVIDQNLKSISLSAKQVFRRQMTGSCVDPGHTDSAGSDSLEYNSNFNRSIPGRHITSYQELNHIQESDCRYNNIYNRCRYEIVKERVEVSKYISGRPIETTTLNLSSPARAMSPLPLASSLDVRLNFYGPHRDLRKNSTGTLQQGQSQTSVQPEKAATDHVSGVSNSGRQEAVSNCVEYVTNLGYTDSSSTSPSSQSMRLPEKQDNMRGSDTRSLVSTNFVSGADSELSQVNAARKPEPKPRTITLQCRDREDASSPSRLLQSHKFSSIY